MPSKSVLVTGASGLIGRAVVNHLCSNPAYSIVATARRSIAQPASVRYMYCDLDDLPQLQKLLAVVAPDMVVHCAAISSPDVAEQSPEMAQKTNVGVTEVLADFCSKNDAHLIFFSTDFVFDGLDGPYSESDTTNPLGVYGSTKLAAEAYVQQCSKFSIVRPVLVYGFQPALARPNYPLLLVERLSKGESMSITADQLRNPTYDFDIATAVSRILETGKYGIFHIGGPDYINMFQFAQLVCEVFDLDSNLLKPVATSSVSGKAHRPLRGGLKIQKAKDELGFEPTTLLEGLNQTKQRLMQGAK